MNLMAQLKAYVDNMAHYMKMMNGQNQQTLEPDQNPQQQQLGPRAQPPQAPKLKVLPVHSRQEKQAEEALKKSDEVNEHSSIHPKRKRNEATHSDQVTQRDLN